MKRFMSKKLAIATALAIAVVSVPVVSAFNKPEHIKANQEPPIVQEIKHQGEVLDNHEDRITNVESDVKVLQTSTSTKPSETRTVVREVVTPTSPEPVAMPAPAPAPEPKPNPLTVVEVLKNETYMLGDGYTEMRRCQYLMAGGRTSLTSIQPASLPCLTVGEIVPWQASGCRSSWDGCS